jgi:hypothetical protein
MSEIIKIDKFISDNNAQQITEPKMFNTDASGNPIPTPGGLFSFDLFGLQHTDRRKTTWGYINLGTEVIHPGALILLDKITPAFRKMLLRQQRYIIKDGLLASDLVNGVWVFLKKLGKS